ncbi:ATP-grasp domain-containing protein [Virgibacillus natechei]|uniref:ATP-grasp domain-containing protein n=1 Tax=Virgibacillus natechei TaxID=1216297 RepID=UPI001AE761C0|nr:ATP-grasp domain-containing protein [Virgibacillus natechei]UZD12531.1 ATP-grasp domain-containing protein [Virgibacillus natechei]
MGYTQKGWLPHLINTIPIEAQRNRISMYTIALEGWRRGLNLKFYKYNNNNKPDIQYSLSYKDRVHHFDGAGGDKNSVEAITICDDKSLTKMRLNNSGIPVPQGRGFDSDKTEEEIIKFGQSINFPVVLKPIDGYGGKGVIVNIKTNTELKNALAYNRNELGFKNVVVEQFVMGDEVRVYVLEGKVIGAVQRRSANVVGDGINTINKLIEAKNQFRKNIPHLYFRPIKVDSEVKKLIQAAGYSLDSIPKAGERIFLRKTSNITTGGDPIEVTSELTTEQRGIAINAVKAIPGLTHCGVDMIINKENDTSMVLELNTRPGIGSHLFPVEGKAKDIPKKIIDFYFPETKGISTEDANVYFDFRSIQDTLAGGTTREVVVAPLINKKLVAKRYLISGDIEPIRYHQWLQRKVFESNLNGFIRRIDDENIEVVIAGETQADADEFLTILNHKILQSQISSISEEDWKLPIKIGFELMNEYNSMSVRELEIKIQDIKKELKLVEKEQNRIGNRIKMVQKSRIWKLTSPLRYLGGKIREVRSR